MVQAICPTLPVMDSMSCKTKDFWCRPHMVHSDCRTSAMNSSGVSTSICQVLFVDDLSQNPGGVTSDHFLKFFKWNWVLAIVKIWFANEDVDIVIDREVVWHGFHGAVQLEDSIVLWISLHRCELLFFGSPIWVCQGGACTSLGVNCCWRLPLQHGKKKGHYMTLYGFFLPDFHVYQFVYQNF